MIIFIIKSTIFLGVVYVLYMMLLAKEKIPVFKRYYLLSGLLLSVIIPFIEFNVQTSISETIYPLTVNYQIDKIYSNVEKLPDYQEKTNSVKWLITALYLVVTAILAGRYAINIIKLIQQKKKYPSQIFNDHQIVLIDQCTSPFSFLNAIYINREEYETIRTEVLIHEQAHVRQKHSIDILLIEAWRIIFWFNPLLWLYKREIRLNHEYLADNQVIKSNMDIYDYQNFMINNAVICKNFSPLSSNYGSLFIKNRLIMLSKEKSSIRTWIKGTMLISIIVLFSIVISCSEDHLSDTGVDAAAWWYPLLKKQE